MSFFSVREAFCDDCLTILELYEGSPRGILMLLPMFRDLTSRMNRKDPARIRYYYVFLFILSAVCMLLGSR